LTWQKNIGMPDSLLSRFDLVFVVRDLTTEAIDRKIATQVLRQAGLRTGADGRKHGVEQIHSSILERRQDVDTRRSQEATEVFQKSIPGPDGEPAPEVLTVDFLRKYLRYCRRLTPVMSEAAQAMVAEKYVDMRMRFQSGYAELNNPESTKKPRLAVTTRTLEAIIRLATAHAKLRLRKDEVLEEDVEAAYRLMLAAREEEDAAASPAQHGGDDDEGGAPPPGDDAPQRGQKRSREESDIGAAEVADGSIVISSARQATLTTLVARAFARNPGQDIHKGDLLETVNAGLAQGEPNFTEVEFNAGVDNLEAQNKIMLMDSGMIVSC